jgi:DNA (cytosine-5)-methyltransferase 1
MLTYLSMAERFKPKWLVWENVPGVLSSNGGRDFGTFITALGKIGYGFSWRILDAQYFGVPQRRRRVFVVGCLGDWRSAASVLFESESLSGNPAPSREERQKVAPTVGTGPPYSRTGNSRVETDALVFTPSSIAGYKEGVGTLRAQGGDIGGGSENLAVTYALPGNWIGRKPENGGNQVEPFLDLSPCQTATDVHAVVYEHHAQDSRVKELPEVCSTVTAKYGTGGGNMPIVAVATGETTLSDVTMSLTASYGQGGADLATKPMICTNIVRRMTPKECERLQGFPDNYSQISWRGKEPEDCPNGHRYKAMGNSMAVPVMRWIGERIKKIEEGE